MRKWLLLMAIALVVTGCGGGKQDQKAKTEQTDKAKTKSQKSADTKKTKGKKSAQNVKATAKGTKKGNKTAAIQQMTGSKQDVVLFLNRAEHAVEDIYYAALSMPDGKTVKDGGFTYRELPSNLDSKDKIVDYLSQFWSKPLALRLYDNLNTKQVDNKVYVALPQKDYPVLISLQNTGVQVVNDDITAVVSEITTPALASQRTIRYHLARDPKTNHYQIDNRSGAYGEEMFK